MKPREIQSSSSRATRTGRGLAAALIATCIAAVAHVAGGSVVGLLGLSLALAFSAPVCVALAGRRMSLPRLSASVILSQLVLHLLFGLGTAAQAVHGALDMSTMSMGVAVQTAASPTGAAGSPSVPMTENGWMLAAHACAAALTIALLFWGERTFWRLVERTGLRVALVIDLTTAHESAAPGVVPLGPPILRSEFLAAGLRRRGPPAVFASA